MTLESPSAAADKAFVSTIIDHCLRKSVYKNRLTKIVAGNYSHTSRSTLSNSCSTRFSICFPSLRRALGLPMCFIQGFSWNVIFSFSWTASVTSCRSGTPRSAATDLARRNKTSGISRVVFISPILPYLWAFPLLLICVRVNPLRSYPVSKRCTSRAPFHRGYFATLAADISAKVHKPLVINHLPPIHFYGLFHRCS